MIFSTLAEKPLGMHNGSMIRAYLPEFLVAVGMSVLLVFAYSMRDARPERSPAPASPRVVARFLVEIESPQGRLRVDRQGQVSGLAQGKLTSTELSDLRLAVERLSPTLSAGAWKMRFYDSAGAHELAFDPLKSSAEVAHVVENLRILGYLPRT
jgi:hypothetical protein